jgi:hypothetical protein
MGSKLISNRANRANNSPRANRGHGSRPLLARRQGQFCLQSGQQPAQRCFIWEHDTTAALRKFDGTLPRINAVAMALAHKLAMQLRAAEDRINRLERRLRSSETGWPAPKDGFKRSTKRSRKSLPLRDQPPVPNKTWATVAFGRSGSCDALVFFLYVAFPLSLDAANPPKAGLIRATRAAGKKEAF